MNRFGCSIKLVRIESLEQTEQLFVRPKRFVPAAWLGKAWQLIPEGREYDIELEFGARVATNVMEVRWHPTQQQQRLGDERCRMTFTVDGIGEIAWRLCGYADQVRILKPAALRERVQKMLQNAVKQHGQKKNR